MRNKWKVSRFDFTLLDKGWPRGDPSVGKGMRGVPKTQDQTCWTNVGGSTKDQGDETSKAFCRVAVDFVVPFFTVQEKGNPERNDTYAYSPVYCQLSRAYPV